MTRIIGISGSLLRISFYSALLRAAMDLMPAGAELKIESIEGIPLYNYDVETDGSKPLPTPMVCCWQHRNTTTQYRVSSRTRSFKRENVKSGS
ncbi:MAG TPA: hypothetical protein VFU37_17910 [Pyrinomonadaceae bacterium]|nr:hypothetical protein [Pyrinomonadaceae bacterium]